MVLHEEFQVLVKALQRKEKIELLTWQELMEFRQKVGEDVDVKINQKLSQFEEKIAMKQKFQSLGIPTAQVALLSAQKKDEYLQIRFASGAHCLKKITIFKVKLHI